LEKAKDVNLREERKERKEREETNEAGWQHKVKKV
jgi:hypothetical protein